MIADRGNWGFFTLGARASWMLLLFSMSCAQRGSRAAPECMTDGDCFDNARCIAGECLAAASDGEPGHDDNGPAESDSNGSPEGNDGEQGPAGEEDPDRGAPQVTILEPVHDAWVAGTVKVLATVQSEAASDKLEVSGKVNESHPVRMDRVDDGRLFVGYFDTEVLGDGVSFPVVVVDAKDPDGRSGSDSRRFGVDYTLAVSVAISDADVIAGTEVEAQCTVVRGGQAVIDVATVVEVSPYAGTVKPTGAGIAAFSPTAMGEYAVRCRAVHSDVTSAPAILKVSAAALANLETILESDVMEAGGRVGVHCSAADDYGNPIDIPDDLQLSVPDDLEVTYTARPSYTVDGVVAGQYAIACLSEGIADPTTATLTVMAGPPAKAITSVYPQVVLPAEPVYAGCHVTDAYDNELPDVETEIVVITPVGVSREDAGIVVSGTVAAATMAGPYRVSCAVPGYAVDDRLGNVVEVIPGPPVRWDISLAAASCLRLKRPLPLAYEVYDAWDNSIANPEIDITTNPTDAVSEDKYGRLVPKVEGPIDIAIELAGDRKPEATIEPFQASIFVDSTPPRLVAESIEIEGETFALHRGATLEAGSLESDATRVTIQITDELSTIKDVMFGDQTVSVSGAEHAEEVVFDHVSPWGLNTISAIASDSCSNFGYLAHSYLRSPSYFPVVADGDEPTAEIPAAVVAHVTQRFIDDRNRETLDDIASLGQAAIMNFDWDDLIKPGEALTSAELTKTCDGDQTWMEVEYEVTRRANAQIVVDGPYITQFDAVDGGMVFDLWMEEISVPLHIVGQDHECVMGAAASITPFDIDLDAGVDSVHVQGELGVSYDENGAQVEARSFEFKVWGGMHLNASCGDAWQDVCDAVVDTVLWFVKRELELKLTDAVMTELSPAAEKALNSFQLKQGFRVNKPVAMHVGIFSTPNEITFKGPPGHGHGRVALNAQVAPCAPGIPDDLNPRGSIYLGLGESELSFSLDIGQTFGIGLRSDLINQILWAAWYDGAFSLSDVRTVIGDDVFPGVDSSLFAYLPPVFDPKRDAAGGRIGIGDAHLFASVHVPTALAGMEDELPIPIEDLPMETLEVEVYASFAVGANLGIDNKAEMLVARFDPEPVVEIQVRCDLVPEYEAQLSVLLTHVIEELLPELLANAVNTFPLPVFDITDIVGTPTELRLIHADLNSNGGYITLQGGLGSFALDDPEDGDNNNTESEDGDSQQIGEIMACTP